MFGRGEPGEIFVVGFPSFLISQVFPNLFPRKEPQSSHELGNRRCLLQTAQSLQTLQMSLSFLGPKTPREASGQVDALSHSLEACSHLLNFFHPALSLT